MTRAKRDVGEQYLTHLSKLHGVGSTQIVIQLGRMYCYIHSFVKLYDQEEKKIIN
jgi:hypothetical protein